MKTLWATAIVTLAMCSAAFAQNAEAPSFSHGPSVPVVKIGFTKSVDEMGVVTKDVTATLLAAGAGYSFNFNMASNEKRDIRWFTLAVPVYLTGVSDGGFAAATGLSFGTYNNLVSIGFIYNLANVVDGPGDTGLLLGEPTREDFSILINFGINFGGKVEADAQGLGPNGLPSPPPPPNYFSL